MYIFSMLALGIQVRGDFFQYGGKSCIYKHKANIRSLIEKIAKFWVELQKKIRNFMGASSTSLTHV